MGADALQAESLAILAAKKGVYASKLKLSSRPNSEPQHKAIIDAMLTEDDRTIQKSIIYHLNCSLITSLKSLDTL